MAKGDHLRVQFGAYSHHGIDLGDGTVIHFGRGLHDKSNARVEIVPMSDFCGDTKPVVVSGNSPFSPDEIVERAAGMLGMSNYDLFDNNCEHFVSWCRQGVANSSQVNVVDSVCRRSGATIAKLIAPKMASRMVASRIPARAVSRFGRLGIPAALAGDAIQLSAELVAIRCGKTQSETRNIGRRSGAIASGGLGFAIGGPVGAAAGFGSWLFGELVSNATSINKPNEFTS